MCLWHMHNLKNEEKNEWNLFVEVLEKSNDLLRCTGGDLARKSQNLWKQMKLLS